MNLEKLFELSKPFLEKNDFGFEHTKRVCNIATKYFTIPENMRDLTFSSIILHDIGGSSLQDQYKKGPKIAKTLLKQLGCSKDFIEKVCEIIKIHHDHPTNPSLPFQILCDSDKLVMFTPEEFSYYDSNSTFSWNKIIDLIYSDKVKQIAQDFLKRKK